MKANNPTMEYTAPDNATRIGLVGTGTIGAGWAAYFLSRGLYVTATDPHPDAEKTLRTVIERAWPSLEQLGLEAGASPDRLRFTTSIDAALKDADFIQESVPEKEAIKDSVIATISEAARPNVVIASSTSGIVPSRLQRRCKNPRRMLVGHPFNPVYLLPLVEVVGGEQTAPETIDWAMAFYRHCGKTALHCNKEMPGHFANRLQDAVMGEMLHLIAEGAASTADLDTALTAGPGLRWTLIGSFITGHMAAGEGGLREVFNGKYGGAHTCVPYPELDKAAVEQIIDDTQSRVAGRSLHTMEKMRDEFLVGLIKLRTGIEAKYGFSQSCFLKN